MAELTGLSASYIHQLEAGKRTPSDSVETLLKIFENLERVGLTAPDLANTLGGGGGLREDPAVYQVKEKERIRMVPVVSWAHAGESQTYEELPEAWQAQVPTECRDERAFAVTLEGESMEPKFSAGDLLILQPGVEPYSGCLAVCRFKDDGVVFRRVEFLPDEVRLVALNPAYTTASYPKEQFAWIYPLWGRWTQIAR